MKALTSRSVQFCLYMFQAILSRSKDLETSKSRYGGEIRLGDRHFKNGIRLFLLEFLTSEKSYDLSQFFNDTVR